jgi:Arc/MetJ-type ribon-helix-helix transcriptional regulator
MSDAQRPNPGDVTVESKTGAGDLEPQNTPGREQRSGALDDFASSVRDFAQSLPGQIGRVIESAQTAIANRANAITIHVDDESQRRIDGLVEAGIFKNRSEAAAYLVAEGIKARGAVFSIIDAKVAEIERLRSEVRAVVTGPGSKPGDDAS